MSSLRTLLLTAMLAACAITQPFAQAGAQASPDQRVYETFRAWISSHPDAAKGDVEAAYRAELKSQGVPPADIDRQIAVINEQGARLEAERWNRILTAPSPMFNTKPNAFLVDIVRGVKPGTALDVGMGQGRNALYLAQQGWTVTGFDPADRAVAAAQQEAARLGVKLTALVQRDDQFEFKKDAWDLVVLSYVSVRDLTDRVYDTLKPGGLVVVEAFHRDALKSGPIGPAVVFDTNELLRLFTRFRVIRYEDTDAVADFGLNRVRVVRLCAQKPASQP
jgi:SAM-dependent methyltransferase